MSQNNNPNGGDFRKTETSGRGDVYDEQIQQNTRDGAKEVLSDDRTPKNGGDQMVRKSEREESSNPAPSTREVVLSKEEMLKYLEGAVAELTEGQIVSLNSLAIKNKYPLCFQSLLDFSAMKGTEVMDEETLIGLLLYNARAVTFNFFDFHEMYIYINGMKDTWYYYINQDVDLKRVPYLNRTLAELAGYEAAFTKLEEKLKSKTT